MMTSPSIDELIEGAILALGNDVMPNVEGDKAMAAVAMVQSVLQGVRQMLPVYDANIVEEHNQMTEVLRNVAASLDAAAGPAAERIHERAASMGASPDLAPMPDLAVQREAHCALSTALAATMVDIDELQREGVDGADAALELVRAHLGPRLVRHGATIAVEGGMIGRG